MTDAELFNELPDDPELAFLQIEKHFKDQCEYRLQQAGEHDRIDIHYVEYISKVIAAIQALGLSPAFETEVPNIQNVDYNTYANFSKDVEHYRTLLQIRHGRRQRGYSVRFDITTKTKIHHHIQQVRDIVAKLEVKPDKREALLDRLNDFAKEVDRDRTRFEAWGAVVIQAAEVLGEAADKAEPARKWFDSIGRLIWGAKEKENEAKQLPAPKEVKKIERRKDDTEKKDDSDDEIPF